MSVVVGSFKGTESGQSHPNQDSATSEGLMQGLVTSDLDCSQASREE